MIKSQIITLRVFYDDNEEGNEGKLDPHQWDWDSLIDEPIRPSVQILAWGAPVGHPRPGAPERRERNVHLREVPR